MRTSKYLIALIGAIVLAAIPLTAQAGGKAPLLSSDLPKFGAGVFGNFGYGSPGLTMAPGIGLAFDDYSLGIHIATNAEMFHIAANLDWFSINQAIPGAPFSLFVGPGVYAAMGFDSTGNSEIGAGLRGVVGIRSLMFGMLEAHAALVPAFGYVFVNDSQVLNWSVGVELGLGYAIPRKKGMSLQAKMPTTPWTPDGDGLNDALGLAVSLVDDYRLTSWSFDVTDPMGKPFYSLKSSADMPSVIGWDGNSNKGEKVVSMQKYGYTLTATDANGITKKVSGSIPVDMVFIKKGNDFQLGLTGFVFVPDSPKLVDDNSDAAKENRRLLTSLKTALERMKLYDTTIVGHAINVSGTDKEEKTLLSLSIARAETIKAELKKLGMDVSAIKTAGKGGTEPIVPNTDLDNRWKNRRVEFIMTPKGAVK